MRRIMLAVATLAAIMAGSARADLVIDFEQVGSSVVVTGSGSVDTAGLVLQGGGGVIGLGIYPSSAAVILGAPSMSFHLVDVYTGVSGPASFGTGMPTDPTSGSGDTVGLPSSPGGLIVPRNYVSGSSLTATDTFAASSFSSLGLTPGTYTYALPHGTVTVHIGTDANGGNGAVVPEPSSLAMLGTAAVAGLAWARRRRDRASA